MGRYRSRWTGRPARAGLAAGVLAAMASLVFLQGDPAAGQAADRVVVERVGPGRSPYGDRCGARAQYSEHTETDARLVVRDGAPLVAYIQDSFFAVSTTWLGGGGPVHAMPERSSPCRGSRDNIFGDQDLALAPDGTVHLSWVSGFTDTGEGPFVIGVSSIDDRILLASSHDGGRTWSPPATVSEPGSYQHQSHVAVDPSAPDRVYVAFATSSNPPWAPRPRLEENAVYLTRSLDGGRSFGPAVVVDRPPVPPGGASGTSQVIVNGVLVTADGGLLVAGSISDVQVVYRSEDSGATWSEAIPVAPNSVALPHPDAGLLVGGTDPLAQAPDGTLFAVTATAARPGPAEVTVSRSTDGGRTWQRLVSPTAQSNGVMLPAVAARSADDLAVLWQDLRHDVPDDGEATTDVWLARSRDGGRTWQEHHLAGPFDAARAPAFLAGTRTLGNYQAIEPTSAGYAAAFAVAPPVAAAGAADVLLARIEPEPPPTGSERPPGESLPVSGGPASLLLGCAAIGAALLARRA